MLKANDNRQNSPKQNDNSMRNSRNNARRSTWSVTHDIWVKEGLKGLFRGGGILTAWTAVGNGLFIGVYEGAKISLGASPRTDSS
jgi:solute carrier family 25 S-adenosylmethionine transporter 26